MSILGDEDRLLHAHERLIDPGNLPCRFHVRSAGHENREKSSPGKESNQNSRSAEEVALRPENHRKAQRDRTALEGSSPKNLARSHDSSTLRNQFQLAAEMGRHGFATALCTA